MKRRFQPTILLSVAMLTLRLSLAAEPSPVPVNPVVIQPYGTLSSLLDKDAPWRVFRSDDPLLTSIRADRLLFTKGEDCAMWTHSLIADHRDVTPLDAAMSGWMPLESKAKDAIEDCDSFPCAVKLNEEEASRMKRSAKKDRLATFLSIVNARAQEYTKSGKRSPYEFPGGISEPWSLFEARGLKSDLALPVAGELGLRRLDFHDSRVRPIRQLVDRRMVLSADGKEASVWLRDVYTDHYFDSWGEWANLRCFPEKGYVEVVFAMSLELDMLKEHDFFTNLAKGSMRNSVRQLSIDYLDSWSHKVQSLTEEQAQKASGK